MRYIVRKQPENLGFTCVGAAFLNALDFASGVERDISPQAIAEINHDCLPVKTLRTGISPRAMGNRLSKLGVPIKYLTPLHSNRPEYSLEDVRNKLMESGHRSAVISGYWSESDRKSLETGNPSPGHAVAVYLDDNNEINVIDNGTLDRDGYEWDGWGIRSITAVGDGTVGDVDVVSAHGIRLDPHLRTLIGNPEHIDHMPWIDDSEIGKRNTDIRFDIDRDTRVRIVKGYKPNARSFAGMFPGAYITQESGHEDVKVGDVVVRSYTPAGHPSIYNAGIIPAAGDGIRWSKGFTAYGKQNDANRGQEYDTFKALVADLVDEYRSRQGSHGIRPVTPATMLSITPRDNPNSDAINARVGGSGSNGPMYDRRRKHLNNFQNIGNTTLNVHIR